jgi:cellulose synthase/poly-beta-1,6-N-acetylglucosamine synthase-like glycosyltransferase
MGNNRKETAITSTGIVVCIFSLFLVYRDLIAIAFAGEELPVLPALQAISFASLVTLLASGGLVYLFARLGYLWRGANLIPPPRYELERVYNAGSTVPSVCILIPSYKEEIQVLTQTILSAALAEYPSRRIVVLLDDPPRARGADLDALVSARHLVQDLSNRFHTAATRYRAELSDFLVRRCGAVGCEPRSETRHLADLYDAIADWIEELGAKYYKNSSPRFAHTDQFFLDKIILAPAAAHRSRATELRHCSPDLERIEREYRRLAGLLNVPITSFERKQYANLSHALNKAMNLNSYICLIGKSFRTVVKSGLPHLEECTSDLADLIVCDAEYLLTLDADSFILSDYILKLVRVMESDPRIAVAQTPYSAIPGSGKLLERAAGAQTDLQYIVHQGFTYFNATYWVGANALLRYDALLDIRRFGHERGHRIEVYIQDRTVIEDTGSTIDLVRQGWRLHNHPERLAYSATPPDFGSLIIQRRRWANGGLIIFADLVRYAIKSATSRPSFSELFMRSYYLCSPAFGSIMVLLLILLPSTLSCKWLLCAALPYYILSARDLRFCGYSWLDVTRVYALMLMLIPVNSAGVLRSVQQMFTDQKAAFCRTPKVENRTSIPLSHLALQLALFAAIVAGVVNNFLQHNYYAALMCELNAAFLLYGFSVLIGFGHAWNDLLRGFHIQSGACAPAQAQALVGTTKRRPRPVAVRIATRSK